MKGCCQVCKSAESKYKCPKCLILYCSLGCFKQHKESCIEQVSSAKVEHNTATIEKECEEGEIATSSDEDVIEGEDNIPQKKLDMLEHSAELREKLGNKHLREMLLEIDSSDDPAIKLEQAMQIPIFREFVDACMNVIDSG